MDAVIVCGGLGTRIQEVYPYSVKSLIEFKGKPFIEYQLSLLIKNGFKNVILCVNYGGDEILKLLSKKKFNINIGIVKDGKISLGTGGAIKNVLNYLDDKFMVLYGDSYLDFDYNKAINKFEKSDKLGLMTIYFNNDLFDKSNVLFDGYNIISFDKKVRSPTFRYIDYGANFFRKEAFENMPESFDLSVLQKKLIEINQMDSEVIPKENRFYEIGSLEGIADFKDLIRRKECIPENF